MKYFNDYQSSSIFDENERVFLLQNICCEKTSSISKRSSINISREIVDVIVAELSADTSLLDHPFKVSTYRDDSPATALVVSELKRIHRDLCKLENSIRDDDISTNLACLFKEHEVLKIATQPGVHAEVQLLEKIVSEYEKGSVLPHRINVGISKLCCLNCRTMLQAANQVFFENDINITLVFQGQHDLSFKWFPPSLFSKGYDEAVYGNGVLPGDKQSSISFK